MIVTMEPGPIKGDIFAIPSKSHLHRLLICASLADQATTIYCQHTGAVDIAATVACLQSLGAKIETLTDGFLVQPLDRENLPEKAVLPCKESGSTFRFMLPVVCALGVTGEFQMEGRLPERPIAPLDGVLTGKGITLSRPTEATLRCEGKLEAGTYAIAGNVSSQYISGLLMALPLLEANSTLEITETLQSGDYIAITLGVQKDFGLTHEQIGTTYHVKGGATLTSPSEALTDGDWSNGAFWLASGAMPGGDITLKSINPNSLQGDRRMADIIRQIGARISWDDHAVTVKEGTRHGIEIDAGEIPDLIPVIAAILSVAKGRSVIKNAGRLRIKESDRLATTASTLNALGAKVTELEDGLIIDGVPHLIGGRVDAHIDHRIAMLAAAASTACTEPVILTGAEAVNKSYPKLWEDFEKLGKPLKIEVLD
ncbi:MAG: 3-phosphoshikimate 1-carboxyvinyltransferase [Defluviitaleaceae bacterium]|nr:3-phosphoshikimate 1-carboxyvinyltransferase [Defluviitaleaceae bacterium]